MDTVVRLENILIENFKNIKSGQLSFANNRKKYQASVLGLYGQNGSGKTALIDAIELLQRTITGQPLPEKFVDYINVEVGFATLRYDFSIIKDTIKYVASYEFKLGSEKIESSQNALVNDNEETRYKPVITGEVLSYAYEDKENKIRKSALIDTNSSKVFAPVTKYICLIGNDKNVSMDLLVAKKVALGTSRSFVFSKELLTAMRNNKEEKETDEYKRHMLLMESLVHYGNFELFIINTANSGIISMNMLPIIFKYAKGTSGAVGNILLSLEEASPIPEEAVVMVDDVIASMNIVLSQIVPGLTIRAEKIGETIFQNGKRGIRVQLVSLKNQKAIPLQYESEGIKKIISILQLLIVVYNHSSITVAIDELDAGIFEYLLGELLRIISEKGKGQLIFTSHNLRPLETLDRGFIAFTTTNPLNRYIRMTKLKENNNLRDFYFRDIILGEQSEEVYATTNNAEIALAFREAGDFRGA
ncbi:AAA family ATPase [Selenomonas sp. KH1T6]|uniref:AAA family ATPase n=1 Tax=Selenomonas sp. KH1T6 TaxID=3158784 RepID=UPI0008A8074C|nr:AAA ATPase domain-containing protein [Selenomonas ruminantium]